MCWDLTFAKSEAILRQQVRNPDSYSVRLGRLDDGMWHGTEIFWILHTVLRMTGEKWISSAAATLIRAGLAHR